MLNVLWESCGCKICWIILCGMCWFFGWIVGRGTERVKLSIFLHKLSLKKHNDKQYLMAIMDIVKGHHEGIKDEHN
jgi:hypothetical protein